MPRPGLAHDVHRGTDVAVDGAAWDLLARLRQAPRPLEEIGAGPLDPAVRRLAELGLVHASLSRAAVRRQYGAALRSGDDGAVRLAADLRCRRVEIAATGAASIVARCLGAVLQARWRMLVVAGSVVALAVLLITDRVIDAVSAAVAPMAIVAGLAVHEAGHLIMIRRVTGRPEAGALVIGPRRLSVVRPNLRGSALRRVAAAGPVAGVICGLVTCLAVDLDPAVGLAGLVSCALHLANLQPGAPDGHDLFGQSG